MSATVTLKVVQGRLHGAEFVFRSPSLCAVGRGSDCAVQLPNDGSSYTISRHHCLLEIDPPLLRVCDLGSLNGTYVNGECIGQRDPRSHIDDFVTPMVPDHALEDGDELRVGPAVFHVGVGVKEVDVEDPRIARSVTRHPRPARWAR